MFDSLSLFALPLHRLLSDSAYYRQLVLRPQQALPAPGDVVLTLLESPSPETLFQFPVQRSEEARCALAGWWLWLDQLDRSHEIVQQIDSASGSFWHAIVHRREGDFSNSRYWYARCASHPALQRRGQDDLPAGAALVALVEAVHDLPADDPRHIRAIEAQRTEWMRLMDHCARSAVGR